MNAVKKLLALLLCLILALPVLPGALAAQPDPAGPTEVYSGSCGDSVSWTLDSDSGELIITGSGDMNNLSGFDYTISNLTGQLQAFSPMFSVSAQIISVL